MNYLQQKKVYIVVWWIGLLGLFTILSLGYFFISLYLSIPLALYRGMFPSNNKYISRKTKFLTSSTVICLAITLAFTGVFTKFLELLWSREYATQIALTLGLCYPLIILLEYRYFRKLSAQDVSTFYAK